MAEELKKNIVAHLLKGQDTDSGYLTLDKIIYIPNFFSIIQTISNRPKRSQEKYGVSLVYYLTGRSDLPKDLNFFEYIIKKGSDGGYNDSIEYLRSINLPVSEDDLKEAMENTHLINDQEATKAYEDYSTALNLAREKFPDLKSREKEINEKILPEFRKSLEDKLSFKLEQLIYSLKPIIDNKDINSEFYSSDERKELKLDVVEK